MATPQLFHRYPREDMVPRKLNYGAMPADGQVADTHMYWELVDLNMYNFSLLLSFLL